MKVSIIYWSGTGNTEAMANTIKDGAVAKGAEVTATRVTDADDESLNADVILFGCPPWARNNSKIPSSSLILRR